MLQIIKINLGHLFDKLSIEVGLQQAITRTLLKEGNNNDELATAVPDAASHSSAQFQTLVCRCSRYCPHPEFEIGPPPAVISSLVIIIIIITILLLLFLIIIMIIIVVIIIIIIVITITITSIVIVLRYNYT